MSQDTIAAQQEHDGRINRRVNVIAFLGLAYLATNSDPAAQLPQNRLAQGAVACPHGAQRAAEGPRRAFGCPQRIRRKGGAAMRRAAVAAFASVRRETCSYLALQEAMAEPAQIGYRLAVAFVPRAMPARGSW